MVPSSAGAVVLVRFPFSDLSATRLRPAVTLADAGRGDWILCQATSNPYADPRAVELGCQRRRSAILRRREQQCRLPEPTRRSSTSSPPEPVRVISPIITHPSRHGLG